MHAKGVSYAKDMSVSGMGGDTMNLPNENSKAIREGKLVTFENSYSILNPIHNLK